jgi:hypothetical protein
MNSSDLGIMVISIIGLFGLASFMFEYLSKRHSKNKTTEAHPKTSTKRDLSNNKHQA